MRFVSTLRSLLLNTDLHSAPKALDAFAIPWSMSGSNLLDDAVTDPRYGDSVTLSIWSSPTRIGALSSAVASLPDAISFVLGMLTNKPKSTATSMYIYRAPSAPALVVAIRAASSAN